MEEPTMHGTTNEHNLQDPLQRRWLIGKTGRSTMTRK